MSLPSNLDEPKNGLLSSCGSGESRGCAVHFRALRAHHSLSVSLGIPAWYTKRDHFVPKPLITPPKRGDDRKKTNRYFLPLKRQTPRR